MRPVLGGSRGLGYMKRNSADALPEESGSHTTLRTSVSLFCGYKAHTLCPVQSSYCPHPAPPPPSKCSHCPTSLAPFSFLSPLQESPPFGMHLHPTHFLQHHLSSLEEPITITSSERLFPDHLNQHSLSSALLLNLSQFFSGFLHSMTPPIKEVQRVKNPPAMQETHVQSLAQEDPLEKGMATHSSILAWEIPWTEELGRLQSMGLQRVGHDWGTNTFTYLCSPVKFLSITFWLPS